MFLMNKLGDFLCHRCTAWLVLANSAQMQYSVNYYKMYYNLEYCKVKI